MGFHDCFERVTVETDLKSQAKLARFLGVRTPTISENKQRDRFPEKWALKIALHYGLSTEWIITGEGPMRRAAVRKSSVEEGNSVYSDPWKGLDDFEEDVDDYDSVEFEEKALGGSAIFKRLRFILQFAPESMRYKVRGAIDEVFEKTRSIKKGEKKHEG